MRNRIALKLGNFDSMYESYDILIPKTTKVALYLMSYFEGMEFDYDAVV